MADIGGITQRHRRTNPKRKREEIYCYDEEFDRKSVEPDQSDQEQENVASDEDEDDSFTYGPTRIKKNEAKKRKIKAKMSEKKGKARKDEHPSKKDAYDRPDVEYVDYVYTSNKNKVELKIFNPQSHVENQVLKQRYQKELEEVYSQFGRRYHRVEEPQLTTRWKYLLRQVEEAGRDFASEREERIKLKRKIAKFSQSTCNRLQQIKQQRVREEQKKIKRQSLQILRHVKREFWGSAIKVRKVVMQQEKKKVERQNKMKKLEDLVAKQFQASQRITQILEGYKEISLENLQVSQNSRVPVVIDVRRYPQAKYIGLHEDNVVRPSLLIKFPLREYQLLGVHWMATLHNRNMNCILADEMGLGKTIQTIALLAHLAIEQGIWGPHLVIVPTTILMNWQIEFKRWCPAFKIMTYFGSTKQRKQKRKGWSKLNSFHICITSYKIAVTDHPIFRRKKWYYMILDEAQNIKNFKSQRWQILLNFKTHSRLLLTGTPLQNDLTQLWSLLHFLMPHVFNSFQDFNEWFNIPFQQALQKNFPISQQILKKLHTVLRPFFLRRLKKDVETQLPKKSEVIIRCGMSRRQKYLYDQVIWHENRKQKSNQSAGMMNVLMGLKKICNHPDLFQPRIEESPLNWVPLTVVIAHHMFLKLHFQTYKTHILKDFAENFKANYEQIAEDILRRYAQTKITKDNESYYKHKYADRLFFAKINYERSKRKEFKLYNFQLSKLECLEEKVPYYMSKTITQRAEQYESVFDKYLFVVPRVMARPARLATFPMSSEVQAETNRLQYLRTRIKTMIPQQLQCIRSRFLLHFPSKNIILYDSGKLIKMVFLLRAIKYRGQKVLIFTQMTKMLDIFQKILNMFKFNYVRLDGNTKTQLRQTIVQRFNNDPHVLCFISSTRSGGIGLNLTGASNVIFYETDWNPAMDKQAQDRCHRIGQTRNVTIYRLITQFSIEENILMKSIQKRKLETLVTEEGMFDTSYFEKVSLKGLLEGAIDYDQDRQADLAEVQDLEDREMLQAAERQRKDVKEEEQEELQVEMLPKLFKYGMKMLQNAEILDEFNQEIEQQEEVSQEQEAAQQVDEEDGDEKEQDNGLSNEQNPIQQQMAEEPENQISIKQKRYNGMKVESNPNEQIYEQPESIEERNQIIEQHEIVEQNQINDERQLPQTYQISTLQKLKAMSIYQSQYLFMKQHFYQQETEPIHYEEEEKPISQKKGPSRGKDKRKKKRR